MVFDVLGGPQGGVHRELNSLCETRVSTSTHAPASTTQESMAELGSEVVLEQRADRTGRTRKASTPIPGCATTYLHHSPCPLRCAALRCAALRCAALMMM